MTKKFLPILTAGILLAGLVVGCGANHQKSDVQTRAQTEGTNTADMGVPQEKLYYILEINKKVHTISADEIEWITGEQKERLDELHLEPYFPDGNYIYNEEIESVKLKVSDTAQFFYLDLDHKEVEADAKGFLAQYEEKDEGVRKLIPYYITMQDGEVIKIVEQYIS